MGGEPSSVKWAIRLHWALILLGLVTTVLTVVLRDDLIRTWAEGHSAGTRELLLTQGLEAVKEGAVRPPAFVPVAIVLFIVVALLIWVLLVFFRNGYNWARLSLTALVVAIGVSTVAGLRADAPGVFVALSFVSFAVELAALVCLWHPQTGQHVRGSWLVHHDEALKQS